MGSPDTRAPCGDEPPALDAIWLAPVALGELRLQLTRAQRKGKPVISLRTRAALAAARDPREVRDILCSVTGFTGIMSLAARRHGWPNASNQWQGASVIARRSGTECRPHTAVLPWLTWAEQSTYRMANNMGESGGRARIRRKR